MRLSRKWQHADKGLSACILVEFGERCIVGTAIFGATALRKDSGFSVGFRPEELVEIDTVLRRGSSLMLQQRPRASQNATQSTTALAPFRERVGPRKSLSPCVTASIKERSRSDPSQQPHLTRSAAVECQLLSVSVSIPPRNTMPTALRAGH